jgi:hypothetical protein
MKKNVAGQVIGAELLSATDGSAFTGTVAVLITGDNGTQTAGSQNSGNATHKGNGYHSYAPSQAETNFDHIAVTFTGSGAVPVTIQVYTTFPQTGDSFARLGAPAGASHAADIATRASQASVDDVPTNLELATALGTADDAVLAAIAALNNLSSAQLAAAIAAGDDAVLAAIAALNNLSSADAQSAAAAALAAYDGPTNAEMVARTLAAASYATAAQANAIEADTQDIQSRLPAALVDGNMPASVEAINGQAVAGDGSSGNKWGPAP